jgi:hypothetical protein
LNPILERIAVKFKIILKTMLSVLLYSLLWLFGCSRVDQPQTSAASTHPDGAIEWTHLSSKNGDLPPPGNSVEQTSALIFDIDNDGVNDFVIASRKAPGPSIVWYRRHTDDWDKYLIEDAPLNIEAGGAFYDIDDDGDLDLVFGGDYQSNEVWWWENPYPNFDPDTPWIRRVIKNSGANKHHDQIFGDFTGNGRSELVFWNQGASSLIMAEIPPDPKNTQPWPLTTIFTWSGGIEHEGLAQADIDGDGKSNIVGGGRWFKHNGGFSFTAHIIDETQPFTRATVGQLLKGGRPEVVFVAGDAAGPLKWYEWDGNTWIGHDLLGHDVDHGHSLEVADLDGDGNLDIFVAEMRLDGGNPDAKMRIFFGDGQGNFEKTEVATGFGNHESRVGDLTGNGNLDILGKPYNWDTPRVDIWLNDGPQQSTFPLNRWERHVIDSDRPWQAIFITSADVDGDGHEDIITGGWWYKNPGDPNGNWVRNVIGAPLNNMAAAYDFDGDGHVDILGTAGQGSDPNDTFVWARNDGAGNFTILENISEGNGDFLQGVAVERFDGVNLSIALSWHEANKGIQRLTVPANPSVDNWNWDLISSVSQDEALSAGDIDGDGDIDLLLGSIWLRNDGSNVWTPFTLHETNGMPDRNRLADINGNGRLDAVIGYEAISQPGKLAWYEKGLDTTALWTEHIIADPPIIGPMSLDVADMDGDGDLDVIVGEHNTNNPSSAALYIFENGDGKGTEWRRHNVYVGDEHHDGAYVTDIDGDGDLDIISIGWTHGRVILYENKAFDGIIDRSRQYLPNITKPSDASTPAQTPTPDGRSIPFCATDGLQALYQFTEGSGMVIQDVSGANPPLNLQIEGSGAKWLEDGGLSIDRAVIIASTEAAFKITDAVRTTNEISIEAWIKPGNLSQDGPARIISLSGDTDNRNITLGQGLWGGQPSTLYNVRSRTTATDNNGEPSLSTLPGTTTTELTHLVYTQSANGERVIYINNVASAGDNIGGNFSNWNNDYRLWLANETTNDRPWLGELHRLAIFNCALSENEIDQKYQAPYPASEPVAEILIDRAPLATPLATELSAIEEKPQGEENFSEDQLGSILNAGIREGWGARNRNFVLGGLITLMIIAAGFYLISLRKRPE